MLGIILKAVFLIILLSVLKEIPSSLLLSTNLRWSKIPVPIISQSNNIHVTEIQSWKPYHHVYIELSFTFLIALKDL